MAGRQGGGSPSDDAAAGPLEDAASEGAADKPVGADDAPGGGSGGVAVADVEGGAAGSADEGGAAQAGRPGARAEAGAAEGAADVRGVDDDGSGGVAVADIEGGAAGSVDEGGAARAGRPGVRAEAGVAEDAADMRGGADDAPGGGSGGVAVAGAEGGAGGAAGGGVRATATEAPGGRSDAPVGRSADVAAAGESEGEGGSAASATDVAGGAEAGASVDVAAAGAADGADWVVAGAGGVAPAEGERSGDGGGEGAGGDVAGAAAGAPRVLLAGEEGVQVLQDQAPEVMDRIVIDSIAYDPTGEVELAGRGSDGAFARIYINNDPVRTVEISPGGQWRAPLPQVDTGTYTLRVDEIDAEGRVTSRAETPFRREDRSELAALDPGGQSEVRVVTVQPGNTLWGIARERWGQGMLYVRVFEANRDSIRDPDLIYPGQVFEIPEDED